MNPMPRRIAPCGPTSPITYTVVAGKYDWDQAANDYVENIQVCHPNLDSQAAKKLYYECRGYDFSRIEDDDGTDVSGLLHGLNDNEGKNE